MADSDDDGEEAGEGAAVTQEATAAVGTEVAVGGFFENPNEPLRMEDLPDDGHDGDTGGGAWPHAYAAAHVVPAAGTQGRRQDRPG